MNLCLVWLIEPVFQSIEHRISGFLKQFFDCFKTSFSKSSSTFLLSLTWQGSTTTFCRFLPQFLQGFPPSKPVRPFYPPFWFYFHVFMHIFVHLKGIFEPPKIWSLGFFGILLYSWMLLINLINLGFYEKLKILGFMLNPIWGFCSIELKLMKLAYCFDVIDHSN